MSAKPIKIFARENLYMRSNTLPPEVRDEIKDRYTLRFYEEKACNKCEFKEDRHSDVCDNCAAFTGSYQMSKQVKIADKSYLTAPIGDLPKFQRFLKNRHLKSVVVERFPDPETVKMQKRIRFTAKLRDHQPDGVQAIIDNHRGVLKAPPRSGKTVMATAAICKIGEKTLILASQRDWLSGFYETFCGSKTQEPMTNARGSGNSVQERRAFKLTGKKAQVGFCKTYEDFLAHDVCLATVQTFHSPQGRKLLKKIRKMFGIVVVDEIQYGAAYEYASVLSTFNARRRIGLTGTDSRKDQKFVVIRMLFGDNVFEVKVKKLRPRIYLTRTSFAHTGTGKTDWVAFVTKLENDKKRIQKIVETALEDVKRGHMVLIPFARVKVTLEVVRQINKKAGKRVAAAFIGGGTERKGETRDEILQLARKYKIKILVGTAKILSVGVNIPRASMFYETTPSSNLENCEQRLSRVLTPHDDKPTPGFRFFLDEAPIRKNCYAHEYWQCVHPTFKPVISEKDLAIWKGYLAQRKQSSSFDFDL